MKPLVLTLGDPAGIGAEIAVKAWQKLNGALPFNLIGDFTYITEVASSFGVATQKVDTPTSISDILPVLDIPLAVPIQPGFPNSQNAQAVIDAIALAVTLVQTDKASAIITNPINKKALKDGAGFVFPGHTEFLADLAGGAFPVMMLSAPELRVVPLTIHIPLSEVATQITKDLLEKTIRVTSNALQRDLGIENPKIAVAGLNPHAGEGGVMGGEEITLIAPVLDNLRQDGFSILGPMSADTMFHAEARENYDLALCMYHDQALIPLKTLNFSQGVNTTLGLPFVRTSPDHGTAYDIAGKGIADPSSLIAAIQMAAEMSERRAG